jgi:hypothetical protein
MMFNQTSRAFRAGMTQTDILESGRAISSMMSQELEQIAPSDNAGTVNFYEINYLNEDYLMNLPGMNTPGISPGRTNVLETLYFLTRNNQEWNAVGYLVTQNPVQDSSPYGTLYHYSASCPVGTDPNSMYTTYTLMLTNIYNGLNPPTNVGLTRVCDGVVHFAIRAYDTNGVLITSNLFTPNLSFAGTTNYNIYANALQNQNLAPLLNMVPGQVVFYQFLNNAVPASVEFELGVLEDRTLSQFQNMPVGLAGIIVTNQGAATMQLFRQRVYLPNVDSTAYQ